MNPLQTIAIALIVASTFISCKNEQEKTSKEQVENNEVLITKETVQDAQDTTFQKSLTLQDISFDISATGEGSMSRLSIQPKGLELNNEKIRLEIEGQVTNAEIEDLNSDGFPELLIYTVSAGSGSYGNVIGYSVNNGKSVSPIYFPPLSQNKEASQGYMGHDEFAIIETTLARRFPIYKDGDTNNNPTGGTRQIAYKLIDGEASRVFVIDNISEY